MKSRLTRYSRVHLTLLQLIYNLYNELLKSNNKLLFFISGISYASTRRMAQINGRILRSEDAGLAIDELPLPNHSYKSNICIHCKGELCCWLRFFCCCYFSHFASLQLAWLCIWLQRRLSIPLPFRIFITFVFVFSVFYNVLNSRPFKSCLNALCSEEVREFPMKPEVFFSISLYLEIPDWFWEIFFFEDRG